MMDKVFSIVGKSRPISDAALKVTGQKVYVDDMALPGMLHAKILLSDSPHVRIKSIDISEAMALPGVRAIATCFNTPSVKYNSAVRFIENKLPDTEMIFSDTVRFVGDRVAAVAADSEKTALKALKLIKWSTRSFPVTLTRRRP